jgi:hypothetical protein
VELVKLFVKLCVERRPEFLPYDWILHHDKVLSPFQPVSSPNGTPTLFSWFGSEWLLFPKIKYALKWRRFKDTEDIQTDVTMALKAVHNSIYRNVPISGTIIGKSA